MRGRPLSNKKKIQLLLGVTILAWATQTLVHQWAHGAELPAPEDAWAAAAAGTLDRTAPDRNAAPAEKFVPGSPRPMTAILELRNDATTYGPEVRLKQICRWSAGDSAVFLPVADLVVMRFDGKTPFRTISLKEIQSTLRDARINLSVVRFAGSLACTVHRSDTQVEQKDALQQWIDAREAAADANSPSEAVPAAIKLAGTAAVAKAAPDAQPAAAVVPRSATTLPSAPAVPGLDAGPVRSLRSALTEDLAIRLALPVEQLQINFNPKDDRVLALSEPQFRFNLTATRAWNLGEVSWEVLVVHEAGSQKVQITATARAWQNQIVVAKPLNARQLIRPEDVAEKRVLVDRTSEEPLLTATQSVGQQTSRDLKPGTVLTSRLVDAVPLAKPGQMVTITLNQGGIRVKTVAKAMEGGSFGQSIRVKNEATNDIYEVLLTGPQEGMLGAPQQR